MAKWTEDDIPPLLGKRILVTGAASGIGYEAAQLLARHGGTVILADVNRQGGEQAVAEIRQQSPQASIEFRPLDLSSQEAIKGFAQALLDDRKSLDILINNAGIQPISERRTTVDGFELTFGIGHLGHFTLTGMLLPLLLKATTPRVVTVSSFMHKAGSFDWNDLQIQQNYSSQRPYNQTKLANLLFARELQRRARAVGATLISLAVHPGVARTAIGANRRRQGHFSLGDYLVSLTLVVVFPLLGQSARRGAWPTLRAATDPGIEPGGFYGPIGLGGCKGPPELTEPAPAGRDMETARKLWEISEQLTGICFNWTPTNHPSHNTT